MTALNIYAIRQRTRRMQEQCAHVSAFRPICCAVGSNSGSGHANFERRLVKLDNTKLGARLIWLVFELLLRSLFMTARTRIKSSRKWKRAENFLRRKTFLRVASESLSEKAVEAR